MRRLMVMVMAVSGLLMAGCGGGEGACMSAEELAGTWGSECGAGCEQVTFDAQGGALYEYWTSLSGNTESSGSFTLACPDLTVELTQGYYAGETYRWEVQQGVLMQDGVRWVKCDGKCF